MRYPKPGYSNPEASLRIFDLETYSSHSSRPLNNPENDAQEARSAVIPLHFKEPLQEPILVDVAWIGASDILVKRSDRFSVILEESHFDLTDREEDRTVTGRTVRQTNFKAVDDGWYEPVSPKF